MQKNMSQWKEAIFTGNKKRGMPIMTFPGLSLTGNSILEMVTQGEVQYQSIKALSERYLELLGVTLVMDLSVEAETFGSKINLAEEEVPTVAGRLINTFDSVGELRNPVIGEGRTACNLRAAELTASNITHCPVFGGIIGPYSLAGRLYDITEIMTGILIEPEGAHALLAKCTRFLKDYAMAFLNAGCNGIVIAEPAAGLLAKEQCEEFSSQYVKEIVNYVQDDNFLVILHNCGNTESLVETMVNTGCAGFHFGNAVNMLEILPQVPSDRLVFGNIDPARTIKNGTYETVKSEAWELLTKSSNYKNFVLSSGCDIPPGTKLENIDAFFDAINEFNKNIPEK